MWDKTRAVDMAIMARRLHADVRKQRLATVGPGIPDDWDRAVEAAWPTIWRSYGVSLPGGWVDVVMAFSQHLASVAPGVAVDDSKEKYGGMRLSLTGDVTRNALDLADVYENLSETVCQDCGEPGQLRQDRGWWATLCDKHAEQRDQR
tara:strand:+ start:14506 stop:14949 length:444 start_codon:yes stop_codon:yes gene_type:complete